MRMSSARWLIGVSFVALVVSVLLPPSVPRHSDPDPRVPINVRDMLIAISKSTKASITPDSSPASLEEIRSVAPLSSVDAKELEGVTFTPEFLSYTDEFGGGLVAYKTLDDRGGYAVLYHFPNRIVFRTHEELMEEIRLRRENLSD
ncbi:MAG TPA: hypothetical protein PKN33_16450 [Phycisphaerae bacterium]|nr:hypothetical protein [Phycisphaerae bacterium]